jgi:hypothetical protein
MTSRDLATIHGVNERISFENYGRMIRFCSRVREMAGGGIMFLVFVAFLAVSAAIGRGPL